MSSLIRINGTDMQCPELMDSVRSAIIRHFKNDSVEMVCVIVTEPTVQNKLQHFTESFGYYMQSATSNENNVELMFHVVSKKPLVD